MSTLRAAAVAEVITGPVEEFAAALAFLTRVPVRAVSSRTGAAAFGFTGALIGAAACWPMVVFGPSLALVAAVLCVATLALVSGALHLDGLADTADALAARDPEAAERARRDPAAGPVGMVAIFVVLALDVSVISGLLQVAGPLTTALCVIAGCAVSRVAAVITAGLGRRKTRPGLARWFVEGTPAAAIGVAIGTLVVVGGAATVLSADFGPLLTTGVGLAAAVAVGVALTRFRHGLDGDVLGASIESTFAVALLAALLR